MGCCGAKWNQNDWTKTVAIARKQEIKYKTTDST